MGSGILGRAVLQAYRKALESKSFTFFFFFLQHYFYEYNNGS